ncbi:hypothetical protein CCUS01_11926 [Colletotrichum cuscutae]|uniref:Secreted protein n=1 Tax=Colletotrichum cuscutae TaxID=1209917 RepID=A0AAI9U260_9PEZI|nr:hypothetical protein CCUS01_11926 [Colletotrichum cuscutae]
MHRPWRLMMCYSLGGVMELSVVGVIGVVGGASSESHSESHWCHQVSSLSTFENMFNYGKASIRAARLT